MARSFRTASTRILGLSYGSQPKAGFRLIMNQPGCLGLGPMQSSGLVILGLPDGSQLRSTWTPKMCKIMAFMAVIMGLGLLFYILLGFR